MAAPSPRPKEAQVARQERYVSHALVEVRKFRILPFGCHSAVLLDISLNGFKLEFTSEVSISPGHQYWLSIPLSPLGIYSPKKLLCRCECRWFDHNRFRIGGVFTNLSKTQKTVIEQAIAGLRARKSI
jgi:hypothetical protein